ncbi:DUF4872 domain-containing protein [Engelhardtia mirabilis]
MEKTGERYTTARAQVLAKLGYRTREATAGSGYPFQPGVCGDTGAVRNWLAALSVRATGSADPLSEAMLTGLAGGVGFLYIVFEYTGTPPLLSVLTRFDSAADRFALGAVERLGLELDSLQTTSAKKARAALDAAIDAGSPALCVVDALALARTDPPSAMLGTAPTLVAVVGREGDDLLIDKGSSDPALIHADVFAAARAAFKKAKHHMVTAAPGHGHGDLSAAIEAAVADCARRYTESPYKGFASNFGLAGMEKWARLLVDRKDAKGWPTLFPEGARAGLALRRTYQGLEHELTPPHAGRGLYAEFLREAAPLTGNDRLAAAARAFDAAAERWRTISASIAECDVPAIRSGCEMLDTYAELLDAQAAEAERDELRGRLEAATGECELTRDDALELYASLRGQLLAAIEAERAAHAALLAAGEVQR